MHVAGRSTRNVRKRHVRFFRRAIAFLDIALQASRDYVVPGVGSTFGAGDDVVDRQIVPAVTAILTSV